MPRPLKWSRDLHAIRDRADRSRTETWSRRDIQDLFSIGASSGQSLMRVIGEIQVVGGTYFIDRSSLLSFLDEMVQADSVEEAVRQRSESAAPIPRPAPLRASLPSELRRITLDDLPANVEVREGEVRITGADAEQVVKGLLLLAQVLQSDLDSVRQRLDPPPEPLEVDAGLKQMLLSLRRTSAPSGRASQHDA